MGTSSDLAVRHRGRTYFQHTSYDGHTENVLSQMAGTIAAAGLEAFRKRMATEGAPPVEDEDCDYDMQIDRKAMGNAYLAACQARGRAPFNLDYAMTYEYGNPDFSHGGAIALLAPKIDWAVGFCDSIEDASVILDLDRGMLVAPLWSHEIKSGSYDEGTMPTMCSIDLASIEDVDPESLAQGLGKIDFDDEIPAQQHQRAVEEAIAKAREGGEPAVDTSMQVDHYHSRRFNPDDEEFTPSIHFLRGTEQHIIYLQPVVDFLREMADEMPVFGEKDTLKIILHENNEQELVVDLRRGNGGERSMVDALFETLARDTGMVYALRSNGASRMVSASRSISSCSSADDGQWDSGLVPDDATSLSLPFERDAAIAKVIESGEKDRIQAELMLAVIALHPQRWDTIQASQAGEPLSPGRMQAMVGVAVETTRHFEHARPGSASLRFSRLSEGQRSAVLEAMTPVDRYMFTQMVGSQRKSSSPRP